MPTTPLRFTSTPSPQLLGDTRFKNAYSHFIQTENDPAAVQQLLLRLDDTLAMLRLASSKHYCRFDRDYSQEIAMIAPELNAARRAEWLVELAVADDLRGGRIDSAVADVTVMFRMSRQAAQAPTLVDALTRCGTDEQALACLADVLPAVRSIDQLNALDIGPADFTDVVLPHGMAGEEALGIVTLTDLIADSSHRQHPQSSHAVYLPPPVGSIIRTYLANDLDSYCAYMSQIRQISDRPWYANRFGVQGAPQPPVPLGLLSGMMRVNIGQCMRLVNLTQSRHASAIVALAITRYHIEHGKWPGQLSDLAPGELPTLPADPFSGEPLRLAKQANQWIIFSVGPGGIDGGADYVPATEFKIGSAVLPAPIAGFILRK